jgi:hypothetical protein
MSEQKRLESVKQHVLEQFPDFTAEDLDQALPQVSTKEIRLSNTVAKKLDLDTALDEPTITQVDTYAFSKRATTEDGTELLRTVKVTVDAEGEIVKATSSKQLLHSSAKAIPHVAPKRPG